jgi:PEP-CTERM motif
MSFLSTKLSMATAGATFITLFLAESVRAFTVFTDRGVWENTVSGIITFENFTSFPNGPLPANTKTVFSSGLSVVVPSSSESLPPDSIFDSEFHGFIDDTEAPLVWNFPAPVIGFGADFSEPTTSAFLTVSGYFDLLPGLDTILFSKFSSGAGQGSGGFLGILADGPFASIEFSVESPGSEAFGMDNFSFVTPVPEPSSWLGLLALGTLGAGSAIKGTLKQQKSGR